MQAETIGKVPIWYLENVINSIFPGLTMFVRDVNLDPAVAEKYVPGMILREKAFTDATARVMGMTTTHRISILSNHMVNLSRMIDDDPEAQSWELCVAQRDSHFKVLDVYEYDGKTQILLLHLPDNENWRLFEFIWSSIESQQVETCRERFAAKCNAEVIPELATDRWLERCEWPTGFSKDGEPFELDVPLEERLRPLGEMGFREVLGNVVFFRDIEHSYKEGVHEPNEEYPDCLAYVYVDSTAGLSAHVLSSARLVDGQIELARDHEDNWLVLRLDGFEDVLVSQVVDDSLGEFAESISEVEAHYGPSEGVRELRKYDFLDASRHPLFPDDVNVELVPSDEGMGVEVVWMALKELRDDVIYAELLNEPKQDLGVHVGNTLPLSFYETKDGMCAFVRVGEAG